MAPSQTITLDVIVSDDHFGKIVQVVHQPSSASKHHLIVRKLIAHQSLHYYRGDPMEAVAAVAGDLCKQMLLRIVVEGRKEKK